MSGNSQEFITIIKLNSEEAKNNLEQLKKRVDDLTAARDKALAAKGDASFLKSIDKDLKKARAELKAYDTDINKTISTINNLSKASVGEIETAMRAIRRQLKSTSSPEEWRELSSYLDLCKERLDDIKSSATQTDAMFEKLSSSGRLVASVINNIDNASISSLEAAQATIEKRLQTLNPSSSQYKEQNQNLLKIKARLNEIYAKQKLVNTVIDQYNAELEKAGQQTMKVASNTELVNRTLKSLDKASIRDLRYSLKIINDELQGMNRGTEEFRQMSAQAKQLKTQLKAISDEGSAQDSWINRLADRFNRMQTLVFTVIASITGMSLTMRKSIQDFLDMDTAMSNVTKYTGQTKDEVNQMNEAFKKMDTRTSREQLNELAASAGRLGISNEKMIKEFVDGADKIQVALGDDLGENAVQAIGKLAQMFGEDKTKGLRGAMLATGSAINELAQNSSASAGYMVDFTSQLSGVAIQAGITQSEMLGLASALDQNQQEAATSATVFSQLITKMFQEPARFAKIAGLEVKEFSRIMKEDANTGLITFLEAMRSRGGFDAMAPLFKEMQLDGTRAVGVLSAVASHLDQVREAQALAFQAYNDGTSVIKEFNVQNETEQAKIDKAKKKFHDLSIELGEKLLPVMRYAVTTGTLLVKGLYNLITFTAKYKIEIVYLLTSIGLLTATYKAASISAGLWYLKENALLLLHRTHNAIIKARVALIGTLRVAMALLTGNVSKVVKAMEAMRAASLSNPYTALLAVILALGYGIYKLCNYFKQNSEEAKRNAEAVRQIRDSYNDLRDIQKEASSSHSAEIAQIRTLRNILENANNSLRERRKALTQLKGIVPQYHASLTAEGKLINNNTSALDEYIKNLRKAALAQAAMNKVAGLESALMDNANLKSNREQNQQVMLKRLRERGFDPRTQEYRRYTTGGGGFIRDKETGTFLKHLNDKQLDELDAIMKTYNYNIERIEAYTKASENINKRIDTVLDQVDKQGASLVDAVASTGTSTSSVPITSSVDENELKKQELEREKRYKKALKDRETDLKTSLIALDAQYTSGEIKYTEFLEKRYKALQDGYDKQLELMRNYNKADTSEYDNVIAKKQEADADYLKSKTALDLKELERQKTIEQAKIKSQYNDSSNEMYLNETALNEALFQSDMNYLKKKQQLYKKSAEEYHQIELEINDAEEKHKLEQEMWYQTTFQKMQQEYLRQSSATRQNIELRNLEEIYRKGLVSEEEYQQMRLAIIAKYSERAKTEEEKTRDAANLALSIAKDRVGVSDNSTNPTNAFAAVNDIFTSVEQQKKVNEELKKLYEENVINYEQYQQAISINDEENWKRRLQNAIVVLSGINNMLSSVSSYAQACADAETAKIQAEYDKQIEATKNNSSKREKLEKERDEKIRKAKNAANRRAMPIQIAQALATTAMNALAAYGAVLQPLQPHTYPLAYAAAAAATAAGMLQVATIKKQQEAQSAGYYEGGFTGGNNYRREAGVVHEGEFVANHKAVNNSAIRPALQLIDLAQRNNTVGSLTASDLSMALRQGNGSVVAAPIVNVTTDNAELNTTISALNEVLGTLNVVLSSGIRASVSIDGTDGVAYNLNRYNRMKGRI
jgi:TP901 family phage tail tape measure protein